MTTEYEKVKRSRPATEEFSALWLTNAPLLHSREFFYFFKYIHGLIDLVEC